MLGFFQKYQYECSIIRADSSKRLTNAKRFGFKPSVGFGERERILGKRGEFSIKARGGQQGHYLSLIKVLAANGIDYHDLSFSESAIIAEDLICDSIRQTIFQVLVYLEYDPMRKTKKYVYDESKEPEKMDITFKKQVKFDAQNMHYSIGLYDIYTSLNDKLEKERKADKDKR